MGLDICRCGPSLVVWVCEGFFPPEQALAVLSWPRPAHRRLPSSREAPLQWFLSALKGCSDSEPTGMRKWHEEWWGNYMNLFIRLELSSFYCVVTNDEALKHPHMIWNNKGRCVYLPGSLPWWQPSSPAGQRRCIRPPGLWGSSSCGLLAEQLLSTKQPCRRLHGRGSLRQSEIRKITQGRWYYSHMHIKIRMGAIGRQRDWWRKRLAAFLTLEPNTDKLEMGLRNIAITQNVIAIFI